MTYTPRMDLDERYIRVTGVKRLPWTEPSTGRVTRRSVKVDGCLVLSAQGGRVRLAGPLLREHTGKYWSQVSRSLDGAHGWHYARHPEFVMCFLCKTAHGVSASCLCEAQRWMDEERRRVNRILERKRRLNG